MNIANLKQTFLGDIILPGDADYEQARKTMMRVGSPAIVVRPTDTNDVARAIAFARDNSLVLSVRCGGHSGGGLSTNDGGMVIDLARINTIKLIDKAKGIVKIGGGALWGDIAKELQKHGLGISSGDTRTVGVGGLTLGGGIGWMVRKHGLALDNLIAAEIVTANGDILQLSNTQNPDLFWAIRGGGGNFGVVTSFTFAAHPLGRIYSGLITYNPGDFLPVLQGWRTYMRSAPLELTTMLMALPTFGGEPPTVIIMACYAGDNEQAAMAAITPLATFGKVLHQDIKQQDYADMLGDAHMTPDMRPITRNVFIKDCNDQVMNALHNIYTQHDAILQLRSIGGAMNNVSPDATAFAHRDSEMLVVSPVFVAPDADTTAIDKALTPWRAIERLGNGAYSNFVHDITPHDTAVVYPPHTLARLAKIKQQYDPTNIFNQNYNIELEQPA